MKILIADDDHELSEYLATSLAAKGCQVITAADAMQAMSFSVRYHPDVILLDVEMPGGTGRNALRNLKKSEHTCDIPVVVMTGSTNPFLHGEMTELGGDGFIEKPLDADALYTVLQKISKDGLALIN
jgi:DNA-binding response OmpR family regulator